MVWPVRRFVFAVGWLLIASWLCFAWVGWYGRLRVFGFDVVLGVGLML